MPDDRRQRLDALIKRRDGSKDNASRVKGRLDGAQKELAAVEAECHEKKVPPEQLESAIAQLTTRFDTTVGQLEQQMGETESRLAPYLEEGR
jgi:septal ring factor EnvC (AmiA/AmiB activator)